MRSKQQQYVNDTEIKKRKKREKTTSKKGTILYELFSVCLSHYFF